MTFKVIIIKSYNEINVIIVRKSWIYDISSHNLVIQRYNYEINVIIVRKESESMTLEDKSTL